MSLQAVDFRGDGRGALNVEPRFLVDFVPPDPLGKYSLKPCVIPDCGRITKETGLQLCGLHGRRYRASGSVFDEWVRDAEPTPAWSEGNPPEKAAASRGVFVLQPLGGKLRVEMAFAIQCRSSGEVRDVLRPDAFNYLVHQLVVNDIDSLLEIDARSLEELGVERYRVTLPPLVERTQMAIRAQLGLPGKVSLGPRGDGSPYFADVGALQPPWLGVIANKWVRYRLDTEQISPQHAGTQVASLKRFSDFLVSQDVSLPEDVTRDVMMGYLHCIRRERNARGKPLAAATVSKRMSAVNSLFEDARALEWEPQLRTSARFMRGEFPRRTVTDPRFLSETVMAQLEDKANLEKIGRPDIRVAIRIIMTTGMRMGHVLGLKLDCLEELKRTMGPPSWALKYIDTKTRQIGYLPIQPDIAEEIKLQQDRVRSEHGDSVGILFPGRRKVLVVPIANQTLHSNLVRWCEALEVRDENGAKVHVTAHRFRHTCGTRWINSGMSLATVMKLLVHRTPTMTMHYARIHDETVRAEWEDFQRVNIAGEQISPPDAEVAEVEWMLENISAATQALPNGYCALPIQQNCPHANACLTCDSFTTGPEFIGVLREQHRHHEQLMQSAEERGLTRMVEINRTPFVSLTNMIAGLERIRPQDGQIA
ncbi:tyrosine-type recombinase/integrase [Paeniglutamicibacter gangotriensis]|nr:tyrosine-type recombinase/integrase [Paeniglutamicibacter gangotriensis]